MKMRNTNRLGFTLVEVLTVIAIIGILVGLLVPALFAVQRGIQQRTMVFEVKTLSDAVEQYKNQFGDYPPDGSNLSVFTSHLRKAWPNIASSEIELFTSGLYTNSTTGVGVMDAPEALVLFLGGLSDDPVYPFSGNGGPFFIRDTSGAQVNSSTPAAARGDVQYNVDRSTGLFEFKEGQLTLDATSGITVSNDEATLFTGGTNDILPVYNTGKGRLAPYVYFDSRTYAFSTSSGRFFNYYAPDAVGGVARPYKSDEVNTTVSAAVNADGHFRYAADRSFQIISAGLDDDFGGVAGVPNAGTPVFYRYPSGDSLNIANGSVGDLTRYSEQSGAPSPQLDNATSFAEDIFSNGLQN